MRKYLPLLLELTMLANPNRNSEKEIPQTSLEDSLKFMKTKSKNKYGWGTKKIKRYDELVKKYSHDVAYEVVEKYKGVIPDNYLSNKLKSKKEITNEVPEKFLGL